MKRGELQAAIADLTRALRVDPEYRKAYQDRAVVYKKLGDYPAALRDADVAIRLRPEDPNGYALRGVIYRSKGDFAEAMADFEFACKQKSIGACTAIKSTKGYATGSVPDK
jgi:tetratricopeptide (TPR) repeat protein